MKIGLKYDTDRIEVELPDGRFRLVLPGCQAQSPDFGELFDNAVNQPWDSPSLEDFIRDRRRLLAVIPDATRSTGAELLLPRLDEYLARRRRPGGQTKIAVATGIHRDPTPSEIARLTGAAAAGQMEVIVHRAHDNESLQEFGQTSFGNRVRLNRLLAWADGILLLGGIGFHYFAGFSGGRKSILPGLAAEESIRYNHNLVFRRDGDGRHPSVRTASLDGNPVHEDMVEAMRLVGLDRIFLFNTILSEEGNLHDLICGHGITAHREACRRYLDLHAVTLERPADIVVASAGGYPRDINMIQAHKTMEMARSCLRPGGVMIIQAACRDGMGHPSFFPWFRFRTEAEFRAELMKEYVIYGQTALAVFEKSRRYRIFLVSALPAEQVRQMGLIPAGNASEAVRAAVGGLPADYQGLILPEGATTFCQVENGL